MDLSGCRKEIDGIDNQILELFTRRMGISAEVAKLKSEKDIGVFDAGRENEILMRISRDAAPEVEGYSRVLFSTIMDLSRSYQHCIREAETEVSRKIEQAVAETPPIFPQKGIVACQGAEGSYSKQACDKLFPVANAMFFKNFEGVFQAVEQGMCEFGILPIENSIYGTVNEVYDLMRNYNFYIVRSLKLQLNHTLLAKPGTDISGIKEIISHDQAIGQCSEYLKSLNGVKVTRCENTALAAKQVAESSRTDIAAISSRECAAIYGLNVLKDDIQKSDHNYTRFICISKNMLIFPGANKISIMLTISHKPGSLYRMISKFSALGVNLTKIESRPIPGRDFEFIFYFDMEASVYSAEVIKLLGELSGGPETFVFLGSYNEV